MKSFLYYLFGLAYFEHIGFYWLSPAPHSNGVINSQSFLIVNRIVQGDRPGQRLEMEQGTGQLI